MLIHLPGSDMNQSNNQRNKNIYDRTLGWTLPSPLNSLSFFCLNPKPNTSCSFFASKSLPSFL